MWNLLLDVSYTFRYYFALIKVIAFLTVNVLVVFVAAGEMVVEIGAPLYGFIFFIELDIYCFHRSFSSSLL
jgi:hypothetical protein